MCSSSFASKAFEEIDFWREREREVQKQPCGVTTTTLTTTTTQKNALLLLHAYYSVRKIFFPFFYLLKILLKFLYFNIKP